MRLTLTEWQDFAFVQLSAEAAPDGDPRTETESLFAEFSEALAAEDLSLANTVRSRIYGRDRSARDAASDVRRDALSGRARAATSSYIAPSRFASKASVAMDLIALRPAPGLDKVIRENDPPRLPCRYLTCGPLIVFSGQTAVLPGLETQLETDILPRLTAYLDEAGSTWKQVVRTVCYLHTSQSPKRLHEILDNQLPCLPQRLDVRFVDGYSAEGKLVEVEVTALRER